MLLALLFDRTLGFPGEVPAELKMGTLNITAWSSWRAAAKFEAPAASMRFLQEHKLVGEAEVARAKKDADKLGLTSVFS